MDKPGGWLLLANCEKALVEGWHFACKIQLTGFFMNETLTGNEFDFNFFLWKFLKAFISFTSQMYALFYYGTYAISSVILLNKYLHYAAAG